MKTSPLQPRMKNCDAKRVIVRKNKSTVSVIRPVIFPCPSSIHICLVFAPKAKKATHGPWLFSINDK